MDLSTFIVSVFCLIDGRVEDRALRARGPLPKLSDAEILTIEIVGEFLGMDTDEAIFRYFRHHYGEWFPALGELHRTTPRGRTCRGTRGGARGRREGEGAG